MMIKTASSRAKGPPNDAPPLAFASLINANSSVSLSVSSTIGISIVLDISPGANVRVPFIEWKSVNSPVETAAEALSKFKSSISISDNSTTSKSTETSPTPPLTRSTVINAFRPCSSTRYSAAVSRSIP